MIDKMLVLTSDHQYYRRSGLLATLRVADAPIENLDFLFSYHSNDYSDAALLGKFKEIGYNLQWQSTDKVMACDLSRILMERIVLKKIVEGQTRTLYMHDDFHFNIKYAQFIEELEQLAAVVDDDIDIISFINRKRDVDRDKMKFGEKKPPILTPVEGAEKFVYGCPYDNGGVYFISPKGAQRLLDEIPDDSPNEIDEIISYIIYEEKGVYALNEEEKDNFFLNVREFEFESVGYHLQDNARKQKMLKHLKKHKLLAQE